MSSQINEKALLAVLQRCRELASASKDSDWSYMTAKEIVTILDHSVLALSESSSVEINELQFLFAPTGPLQETAMSNGWSEEFLVLAERFDDIIGESS